MYIFRRMVNGLSSLKFAISLLIFIAIASAIGTIIPQNEPNNNYLSAYNNDHPWLGFISGEVLLKLQFDHVYSSSWFLALLNWLGIALMLCTWRRQWPSLRSAMRWTDYKEVHQLSNLSIAETISTSKTKDWLNNLANHLQNQGWQVLQKPGRLAARKGVIGRAGPPLVHIGIVLLMLGAAWGALGGQRIEQFLAPGGSFDLIDREGVSQLRIKLTDFNIERDPAGRTEQFRSKLELHEPKQTSSLLKEVSVNHPLRFKGVTIYQADWSLEAITLQLGENTKLQLPLTNFPELGEQVWGIALPTTSKGEDPILMTLSNEKGPIDIFDSQGNLLTSLRPAGGSKEVKGMELKVSEVMSSSGLLLKRDPGVPLVYTGFAITLLGGGLSILATKQIWALSETNTTSIHIGGLCNRSLTGLAKELPQILSTIPKE